MDFLSLSSPSAYSILTRSRILASASDRKETLDRLSEFLPKDIRERAANDATSYSASLKTLGATVVDYFDPEYPPLLKEIYDPPPNLFCMGDVSILQKNFLAVVGTRKASPVTSVYCKAVPSFLRSLGMEGMISGLALGVDAEAMNRALDDSLPVLGVMGTGPEKEYPFENRNLYRRMKLSKNSLIITECPPGFEVRKYAFPKRNRIITGIAPALLLMEAPAKSGALSSASNAIAQNREIYVFDHPYQFQNEGGRKLLSEGASPALFQKSEMIKIMHVNEILSDNFEELPGMLAILGKQRLDGNWIDLGSGFLRSQK